MGVYVLGEYDAGANNLDEDKSTMVVVDSGIRGDFGLYDLGTEYERVVI